MDKRQLCHDERESILYQLINKDNWEALQEVECFLFIFDTLPKRQKTAVDLRMTRHSIDEIAKLMKISVVTVYRHLSEAKKRLFTSVM